MTAAKRISLIVICHRMARQMANTIYTLGADYQRHGGELDYEVIIVENESDAMLPKEFVSGLPGNFHYFLRAESSPSPAAAINYALQQARGETIGIMIDGAHMLSPGVLYFAHAAMAMQQRSLVTVPAYHLGPAEQHESSQQGYDEAAEQALLAATPWRDNGYALFNIASNCGANPRGFLAPIIESNCYFAARSAFAEIGGADESFQQAGGGALNLHMLRQLALLPDMEYFCLGGEGSFHQYHGGVTSNTSRADNEDNFNQELQARWQGNYRHLERNPIVLGHFKPEALALLGRSSESMQRRFSNCRDRGWPVWGDDDTMNRGDKE